MDDKRLDVGKITAHFRAIDKPCKHFAMRSCIKCQTYRSLMFVQGRTVPSLIAEIENLREREAYLVAELRVMHEGARSADSESKAWVVGICEIGGNTAHRFLARITSGDPIPTVCKMHARSTHDSRR